MPKSAPSYVVLLNLKFSEKVSSEKQAEITRSLLNHATGDHPMEEHTFRLFPVQDAGLTFMCGSSLAPRFIRRGMSDMIASFYKRFVDEFNDVDLADVSVHHMILEIAAATAESEDFLRPSKTQ